MATKKKMKPDKDGRVKLTKTKAQYTLAEILAMTDAAWREVVARALGLIK